MLIKLKKLLWPTQDNLHPGEAVTTSSEATEPLGSLTSKSSMSKNFFLRFKQRSEFCIAQ